MRPNRAIGLESAGPNGLEGRKSLPVSARSAPARHSSGTIMAIFFHEEDLPSLDMFAADAAIAVDT